MWMYLSCFLILEIIGMLQIVLCYASEKIFVTSENKTNSPGYFFSAASIFSFEKVWKIRHWIIFKTHSLYGRDNHRKKNNACNVTKFAYPPNRNAKMVPVQWQSIQSLTIRTGTNSVWRFYFRLRSFLLLGHTHTALHFQQKLFST